MKFLKLGRLPPRVIHKIARVVEAHNKVKNVDKLPVDLRRLIAQYAVPPHPGLILPNMDTNTSKTDWGNLSVHIWKWLREWRLLSTPLDTNWLVERFDWIYVTVHPYASRPKMCIALLNDKLALYNEWLTHWLPASVRLVNRGGIWALLDELWRHADEVIHTLSLFIFLPLFFECHV